MSRLLRFLLAATLVASAFAAQVQFPQDHSDLKADPAARFGVLPNGVRYVVRANKEPKGRAALRIVFLTGSLMEKDSQQGLAHFLEHMSFNGSQHYAPGTLIEFFQRLGMDFGGDTNAYTSFDHTAYMIDLPDTKPETVAEGLQVFRDYAAGLLLLPKEIDKERGVILAEKRARDSVAYRTFVAEYKFLFGDSRLPLRLPIGQEAVIEHADQKEFLDLYNTWYRPERTIVIAVGDFDPALVEKKIVEDFSTVTDRAPARPAPNLGAIPAFNGLRVAFHPEPEAPSTRVSLSSVTPWPHEVDSRATRLKDLPRELALAMLNQRLAILAKKEGAPFIAASVSVHDSFHFARQANITVTCKPEQWKAAVGVAEQELRRALAYGFQPAELKEAVANLRNDLEQAVRTDPTRRSADIARDLIGSLVDDEVFTSPAEDLALYGPALQSVDAAQCLAALKDAWAAPDRYLFVTGNCRIDGDAPAAVRAAYEASVATGVTPPDKIAEESFAYTDFGSPASVVSRRHVDDLDITQVEFSNGVRLNIKKTDFEKDRIHLRVRVGSGQLLEPRNEPGLAAFGSSAFLLGGLGKHSFDDLQRLNAGHTVQTGFQIASDALQFSGATNRDDLLRQLDLITAEIVDPGYRPEAMRMLSKVIDQFYNRMEHTPDGPLQIEVPRLLADGDTRFGLPPRTDMNRRSLDELRAWLAPQLAKGAIEVAIDGDLDVDATIAAVARTLGALPAREPRPALDDLRKVSFPAAPVARAFTVETKIPKAVVATFWPTTDASDAHVARRLSLLADVFSDRLRVKVREELGEAYSPYAVSAPNDTYKGYGFLFANVIVDPALASKVAAVVDSIADDLSTKGITDDELVRAKRPVLTQLRESARTNGYWLAAVLSRAQEKPVMLDWARDRYSDVEGVTKADIDALAAKYLSSKRAFHFVVEPK